MSPSHDPARPQTPRELRTFAWTVGGAFLALAALFSLRGRLAAAGVCATPGLLLLAAGLVAPARLGPLQRGWMALALAMSRVTTPLFMGVVYFAVLTPIGLLMRLLGRRPLARSRAAATYWVDRPPGGRRSDLRRQF